MNNLIPPTEQIERLLISKTRKHFGIFFLLLAAVTCVTFFIFGSWEEFGKVSSKDFVLNLFWFGSSFVSFFIGIKLLTSFKSVRNYPNFPASWIK